MNESVQTAPLDELVELRPEKVVSNKDPRLPYVGLEHIAQGQPRLLGFLPGSASVSVNCQFAKDDILFGKLRPNLRKSLRMPFAGYCSTDILVLRARNGVRPDFAGHMLQWERVFANASATAAGTKMPRTSWNELKRLCVFRPATAEEQSRIALVLDTVDEAIAKTEAVIAKLRQVRAGLLHDLLTRGLDENGQLRDPLAHPEQFQPSPLGRIPKEWRCTKFAEVLEGIDAGKSPDYPDYPAPPGEWGVLKVSAIWPDGFRPYENKWVTKAADQIPAYQVRTGDLLISRSNTYQLVGLVCLVENAPPRLILCDKTLRMRLKPKAGLSPFFCLLLQTRAARVQIEINATGTSGSMKNISQDVIRGLRLAYPGVDEQLLILKAVQPITEDLSASQCELQKLTSLKTGLMADLLTGRVRVPPDSEKKPARHVEASGVA